jgi:hypothetical protein
MRNFEKNFLTHLAATTLLLMLLSGCKETVSERYKTEVQLFAKLPYDTHLDAVKWTEGFWQDRMQRLRDNYIPGVIDGSFMTTENGSTFRNFLRAAGKEPGQAVAREWSDGDCYYVLDAVARSYAYHPDEYLKSKLDYWIPIIGSIQQEDGVVDTWMTLGDFEPVEGDPWRKKLSRESKERRPKFSGWINYNTAHMYFAAASHKKATGDDSFMKIADKLLNYFIDNGEKQLSTSDINNYYEGAQVPWAYGMKYAHTIEERFLTELQRIYNVDESIFGPPLRDAQEIFGHNTYTAHYLTGGTNLYNLTGEAALLDALKRLAGNLISKKTYLTGAVAPVQHVARPELKVNGKTYKSTALVEGIGQEYDLPNETSYCETCGQCLYMEWFYQMFRLTGEGTYMDAAERMLYNATLGCVDIDKPNFFYCNPQEQLSGSTRYTDNGPFASQNANYSWKRQYTKKCACCPPKVLRALALTPEMAYNVSNEGLWVNLYGGNTFNTELPWGGSLKCEQKTNYPWDGKMSLKIEDLKSKKNFTVFLRIPGWVNSPVSIKVNGRIVEQATKSGTYHELNRNWGKGDLIEMELPMPVRYMVADPRLKDNMGKVAIMRGPVVYCIEDEDMPEGMDIESLNITGDYQFEPVYTEELGGLTKLTGSLVISKEEKQMSDVAKEFNPDWGLYQEVRLPEKVKITEGEQIVQVKMIPYYARLNRDGKCFRVWHPLND